MRLLAYVPATDKGRNRGPDMARHWTLTLTLALMLGLPAAPSHAERLLHTALPAEALATTSALVVDIRRPEEWVQTGVLPNALLLTFTDPDSFARALRPHLAPGQPVMLICRTGNRTAQATALLTPRLDAPVIDVRGGMVRLMSEGYRPAAPRAAQGCTIC